MPVSIFVPSKLNDIAVRPSGSDDTELLQWHLDRAGSIILGDGEFTFSDTLHPQSDSHIAGLGMGITILQSGDIPSDDPTAGYTTKIQMRPLNVNNVLIRDLTLKALAPVDNLIGITAEEGCNNVHFLRIEATGQSKPPLRFNRGVSNSSIIGCYVHDTIRFGSGILIDQFIDASGVNFPHTQTPVENILVAHNVVVNSAADFGQGSIGIFNSGVGCIVRGIRILGNIMDNGVLAVSGTPNGLFLNLGVSSLTEDVLIQGNQVKNMPDTGGFYGAGFYLKASGAATIGRRISAVDNHFLDNYYGIIVQQDSPSLFADLLIDQNLLRGNTISPLSLIGGSPMVVGPNLKLRNNTGFASDNTGTATVANGTTSIAVSHGLDATPALSQITVTPTNNLGSATKFWVSNVTSTQFTINVDANPGATTATFVWKAELL